MCTFTELRPYLDPKATRLLAPPNAQPKRKNMVIIRPFSDQNGAFAHCDNFYRGIAENDRRIAVVTLSKGDCLGKAKEFGRKTLNNPERIDVMLSGHGYPGGIAFGPGDAGIFSVQQIHPEDFRNVDTIYLYACNTFQFGQQLAQITLKPVWAPLGSIHSYEVAFYSTPFGCEMAYFSEGKNLYRLIFPNGNVFHPEISESVVIQKMKDRVAEAEHKGKESLFALEFLSVYYCGKEEFTQAYPYIQKGSLKDVPICKYLAGACALSGGDVKTAISYFSRTNTSYAQLMLGKILLWAKEYSQAIRSLEWAAQHLPEASRLVRYAHAHLLCQQKQWEKAVSWFEQFINESCHSSSIDSDEEFLVDSFKQLQRLRAFSPQIPSFVRTVSECYPQLEALLSTHRLFRDIESRIAI